ncbi:hypothetical protein FRAHR75_320017 [Frankia sp. Hr75.2]|nr:hypothetical protein FRAHR75_320017 [Frankia sp. Hr75.2]SQD98841.1 hypothetical protein FMEAI12_4930019 [Parafrankia sp. Ea1.12]
MRRPSRDVSHAASGRPVSGHGVTRGRVRRPGPRGVRPKVATRDAMLQSDLALQVKIS